MNILFIGARKVGLDILASITKWRREEDYTPERIELQVLTLDEVKEAETVAFFDLTHLCKATSIPFRTFASTQDMRDMAEWYTGIDIDLGIVCGVSQIVPDELLAIPRHGFIGMHPTFLPQGRGRAPIPWAIIKGIPSTGVSWFDIQPGQEPDSGAILDQTKVEIFYEDTCQTLGERCDAAAADLLYTILPDIARNRHTYFPQNEEDASYWNKRNPEDGLINWGWHKRKIYNWIRALTTPYPGAFTYYEGKKLYIWSARESDDRFFMEPKNRINKTFPHGVVVGNILVQVVQFEDDDVVPAAWAGLKEGTYFEDA